MNIGVGHYHKCREKKLAKWLRRLSKQIFSFVENLKSFFASLYQNVNVQIKRAKNELCA